MLAFTSFYEDPITIFLTGLALLILFFWYFATEIERRKRNVGTVLTIGVCALCVLAATPLKERLKGGIDIIGGSSFSLRVQPREADDGTKMPVTVQQIDQAIIVIEKRLNSMGTSEPLIARQGDDGILVQMPGVKAASHSPSGSRTATKSSPDTAPTRSRARTRMATNTSARSCSTAAWHSVARTSPTPCLRPSRRTRWPSPSTATAPTR